ncbi:hypothetical protein [Bradyrhizobium manausense]|uniref:Uncharacterized protein n=1 Tax=Bradyrhizobium manausense TaxID=989370 RepID=A0A0R3DA75_9BRAD|nr:hypothetical protein [Bradyrhizobium manausense]KRQ04942.1 hypothetical protein AOQ71_29285 [Bradyrhizobium manausense]
MQIRVQRTVHVLPEFQRRFLDISLKSIEHFRAITGVEPDLFVNLRPQGPPVEVCIFADFESMAQYEDIFLHKALRDNDYLDVPEATVEMIYEQPLDEMYVRLDVDDHFMNRKGDKVVAASGLNLSRNAPLNKKVAAFRTERMYRASKGRLRDMMLLSFEFLHNLHRKTGHAADLFCTRFSIASIGSVKAFFDHDDCPECGPAFLQQDHEIATQHQGLLQRPPITTIYQRILPATIDYDLGARDQPVGSA